MIFHKNLKGIVTVDPVEVTYGDGWKVNFGLETHIRARYNWPLPKINQNLGSQVRVIQHHLIIIREKLISILLIFIGLQVLLPGSALQCDKQMKNTP